MASGWKLNEISFSLGEIVDVLAQIECCDGLTPAKVDGETYCIDAKFASEGIKTLVYSLMTRHGFSEKEIDDAIALGPHWQQHNYGGFFEDEVIRGYQMIDSGMDVGDVVAELFPDAEYPALLETTFVAAIHKWYKQQSPETLMALLETSGD